MNYLSIPQIRVTLAGEVTEGFMNGTITLVENDFWVAQLNFRNDPPVYPDVADIGDTVKVEIKDGNPEGTFTNYVTLFDGNLLYPNYSFGNPNIIVALQCVGKGYALAMMNCAEEYGTQSRTSTYTITEILAHATYGVIPKWVNKYQAIAEETEYDSGYNINFDNVETITGTIPYIISPYKPVDKFLGDLCDLSTALSQESSLAGPHWIVDHNGNLRLKRIGATQTGWTKYYGDSQGNATLTAGVDFLDGDFQPVGVEANVVVYNGIWRRPANGDGWTNGATTGWGTDNVALVIDTGFQIVGSGSLKATISSTGIRNFFYPSGKTAGWNIDALKSPLYIPYISLHVSKHQEIDSLILKMCTSDTAYLPTINFGNGTTYLKELDKFFHFQIPIGSLWDTAVESNDFKWDEAVGAFSWENVNFINFEFYSDSTEYIHIDGLNFGNVPLRRIARQEFPDEIEEDRGTLGTTGNPVRFKVITDNVGKDDSLSAPDDSGVMAQLAKAELLRLAKPTIIGKFSTRLIPDILPGQYVYIGTKNYRIKKLIYHLGMECKTSFEVTDDLTNSHSRMRYEDINKVYAAIRPEWQDRQSSSIKAGNIDINIVTLEKPYNI